MPKSGKEKGARRKAAASGARASRATTKRSVKASRAAMRRAERVIPGGVNSPVRAFGAIGGVPRFIDHARGCRIHDIDGNEYIDYVGSWGPMIVGHAHPRVLKAIRTAMARGTSFGAPTEAETELAVAVRRRLPSVQMLRMVSSGTEATMSAIRLARGYTGRARVLKFDGCYHGHSDGLLVGAGSGVATLGLPGSPGVPAAMTELTVQAPYNDLAAVETAFSRWKDEIACVIVEPIAGNMGCVLPVPGFLDGLRRLCSENGALLIFDEVMTGFRVARGGAQRHFGIEPDLTCLGKVVGGGLPAAAYGGRRDIMHRIAPAGDVYQAGTLSGNPLAVAAGLATLELLEAPGAYAQLAERSRALTDGLAEIAREHGIEFTSCSLGGMFGFFFHPGPVHDFAAASKADGERFRAFHAAMLAGGVYLAPSPFEAGFVSLAHRSADIDRSLEVARIAMPEAARAR